MIWQAPPEVFHLLWEGLSKQIMQRLFTMTSKKANKTLLTALEDQYCDMKVLTEMPRCSRSLRINLLRGNELKVITMSVFPALIDLLHSREGRRVERR